MNVTAKERGYLCYVEIEGRSGGSNRQSKQEKNSCNRATAQKPGDDYDDDLAGGRGGGGVQKVGRKTTAAAVAGAKLLHPKPPQKPRALNLCNCIFAAGGARRFSVNSSFGDAMSGRGRP